MKMRTHWLLEVETLTDILYKVFNSSVVFSEQERSWYTASLFAVVLLIVLRVTFVIPSPPMGVLVLVKDEQIPAGVAYTVMYPVFTSVVPVPLALLAVSVTL